MIFRFLLGQILQCWPGEEQRAVECIALGLGHYQTQVGIADSDWPRSQHSSTSATNIQGTNEFVMADGWHAMAWRGLEVLPGI